MESNKLIVQDSRLPVLDRQVPLRAIPKEDLNKIILTTFLTWLSNLLSLTGETSANRLKIALPALKDHCWSLGFKEIKKIFEMYADGKLSVKPLPNYFDRVLLGQIVNAYNQQKPKKKMYEPKQIELTEQEKEEIVKSGCRRAFENYIKNRDTSGANAFVYEYLFKKGHLPKDKKTKIRIYEEALVIAKRTRKSFGQRAGESAFTVKRAIQEIENGQSQFPILIAKRLALEEYFAKLVSENRILEV